MLLSKLYEWLQPNRLEFKKVLKDGAKRNIEEVFTSMDNCEIWLIVSFLLITIVACISYFTWYNKMTWPLGYHYRKSHWIGWFVFALVLIAIVTLIICSFIETNNISIGEFITGYVVGNLLYGCIVFLLLTFVCHNCMTTNAYRFWKIGGGTKN